jgi:acyl-CoA synthetase (AMP-forming)/AMP-acid ligase II
MIVDAGAAGNGCPRTITLDEIAPRNLAALASVPPAAAHEGGAAIFVHYPSSGTTGRPKFTSISHDLALRRADRDTLGLARIPGGRGTAALRQACHLVPGTSYGFSSVLIALSGGGTVLEAAVAPAEVPAWLVASRANYLVTSPILLMKTVESLPAFRAPHELATIEVGGGALPRNVYELARDRLCSNITVNYGSTESGRVAWMPGDVARNQPPGAVGYPYPGVQIEIVDDLDGSLPAGTEAIVRIRSAQNATGYLDDPETSAAVFRNGWIYPGDRGVLHRTACCASPVAWTM